MHCVHPASSERSTSDAGLFPHKQNKRKQKREKAVSWNEKRRKAKYVMIRKVQQGGQFSDSRWVEQAESHLCVEQGEISEMQRGQEGDKQVQ